MPRLSLSCGLTTASCLAVVAGIAMLGAGLGAGAPPEGHEHAGGAGGRGPEMPLIFSYYLPNCVINSGEEMNPRRAVVMEHEGREVRFCCEGCVGRFERDPASALARLNEKMIEDQMPLYPMTTCLVMDGHELGDDAINMIYKNRLVRLCCDGCIEEFGDHAEDYLRKLDQAVVEAQGASYPFTTCVVANHDLADGENPMRVVVGGRLIYLCCDGCLEALQKNPAEYVAMIDRARREQASAVPAGR